MSFRIPRRDTEIRFVTKFGENRPLRSCRKVAWFSKQKKLALRGTRPSSHFAQNGPIAPKIPRTLSTLDVSTYTEFGPDRLRFAMTYSGKIDFSAQKVNRPTVKFMCKQFASRVKQQTEKNTNVNSINTRAFALCKT